MTPGTFEVIAADSTSGARRGRLWTAHGPIETPVFMPVGSRGTVKAITPASLEEIGVQVVLGNTYHLMTRPGVEVVESLGGLHRFMGWKRPILTDSGGFQAFSLSGLRKIRDEGVEFSSHVDGQRLFLGPVEAMDIQRRLGSDIAMVIDECPPYPCDHDYACIAVERTIGWAALCLRQARAERQLVFGIVQGSNYPDLRERCARELAGMGFDGLAIGGVSVGEPEDVLLASVASCAGYLPADKPRYLMGVGIMRQMVEAVAQGVDMFDCVLPTRLARNGTAFTRAGSYPVKSAEHKLESAPIEEGCGCYACRNFSRGYVRHLVNVDEILGIQLLTIHNLNRYMEFMAEMRSAIAGGTFAAFRRQYAPAADGSAQ